MRRQNGAAFMQSGYLLSAHQIWLIIFNVISFSNILLSNGNNIWLLRHFGLLFATNHGSERSHDL